MTESPHEAVDLLSGWDPGEVERLRAIVDTVIPEDEWPGGWAGGVQSLLRAAPGAMDELRGPLRAGVAALEARSRAQHGRSFTELAHGARLTLIERECEHDRSSRPHSVAVTTIVRTAFLGFYAGTRRPAGWSMVGFDPGSAESGEQDCVAPTSLHDLAAEYDAIVIGSGAGGGAAAAELARQGLSVLVLERADAQSVAELRSNHVQGKRLQVAGVLAGPGAGHPRTIATPGGGTRLLRGDGDGYEYGLVAMTLGGGTRLWQGMSWRFCPEDFRMASEYGVPEDSTLADWPFDYEELAPFYDRAEWELGVAGDAASPALARTMRGRPLPMPAFPPDRTFDVMQRAAAQLGWATAPVPLAINTIARDGRPACSRCGQCLGHACPVNAKNGSHNTFVPRALAAGAHLVLGARAVRIEHDGQGIATGVRVLLRQAGAVVERVIHTARVLVAAGAVETPRLLLLSGLGNTWVGRNFHSHGIALAFAFTPDSPKRWDGPGHSIATDAWLHRGGSPWGGGVIFDMFAMYPAQMALEPAVVNGGLGARHKARMRQTPPPLGAMSLVQDVPHKAARVSLDPTVRDRDDIAVARFDGAATHASRDAVDFMAAHVARWVEAAVEQPSITTFRSPAGVQGSEHSAGTVRLGSDPSNSACDPRGLLWGTRNVWVADASLHPTNGGVNPALTVFANALRVASFAAAG